MKRLVGAAALILLAGTVWAESGGRPAALGFLGRGALVRSVATGGPAAEAGIRAGDVITRVNEIRVDRLNSLSAIIHSFAPRQSVSVTLLRSGSGRMRVRVRLGRGADGQALLGVAYSSLSSSELWAAPTMPLLKLQPFHGFRWHAFPIEPPPRGVTAPPGPTVSATAL